MDVGFIGKAMAELERVTNAVVEGREDSRRLAGGLQMALAETESFVHRVNDDIFVTDDASGMWKKMAAESAGKLCACLVQMMRALEGGQIQTDTLLQALASTLQAERQVRVLFHHLWSLRQRIAGARTAECPQCGHTILHGECDTCGLQLSRAAHGADGTVGVSVFLERLEEVLGALETPGGVQAAIEFVHNLEQLTILGARQLDTMLTHASRGHEATTLTLELRIKMELVRVMLEAVRDTLQHDDEDALRELTPWLAEQFNVMLELRERLVRACSRKGQQSP